MTRLLFSIALAALAATPAARAGPPGPQQTALTVVDDRDRPLTGVSVRAQVDGVAHERTTDAAGTCSVPRAAERLALHLEHPEHFHLIGDFVRRESLTLKLPRLARLRGRAVDASTGLPLPDARATLIHPCHGCAPQWVSSDAQGHFLLPEVPCGQAFRVLVQAQGFGELVEQVLLVDPEGANDRTLRLKSTRELHGVVLDALDGSPIGDAEFMLGSDGSVQRDGTFVLHAVPFDGERVFARIAAPGYCQSHGVLQVGQAPGQIPLVPGVRIEGRVVHSRSGAAVAGASIAFRRDRRRQRDVQPGAPRLDELLPADWSAYEHSRRVGPTDEDGGFQAPALLPYMPYELRVYHPDYQTRVLAIGAQAPGARVQAQRIALVPDPEFAPASWRGRMRLNGTPIGGSIAWRVGDVDGFIVVADDGHFSESGIPPGTLRGTPAPRGDPSARVDRGDFGDFAPQLAFELVLPEGAQRVQDLELTLDMLPIAGSVRTANGLGVAGAWVQARAEDSGPAPSVQSDASGRFRIEVPAGGANRYQVLARHGQRTSVARDVAPGALDLTLSAAETGRLRVTRSSARSGGEPWSLYWREAEPLPFERLVADGETQGDVWFEAGLAAGRFELAARRARGGPVERAWVTIPARDSIEVALEPPPASPLELVLDASSEDPRYAAVLLVPASQAGDLLAQLAAGGRGTSATFGTLDPLAPSAEPLSCHRGRRLVLPHVAPGTHNIVVHPPNLTPEPAEIVVPAGDRAPIPLRFHRN